VWQFAEVSRHAPTGRRGVPYCFAAWPAGVMDAFECEEGLIAVAADEEMKGARPLVSWDGAIG
jgi:hypothetical protein